MVGQVFSRPEFQWVERHRVLSWLLQQRDKFRDWLNRLAEQHPTGYNIGLGLLVILLVWLPTALGIYIQVRFSGNPQAMLAFFEEHAASVVLWGLVLLVVFTTAGLLLRTGTIRIISDSYLGQEPTLGSALRLGTSKIIPLLLVTLSKSLLLVLLMFVGVLVVLLLGVSSKIIGGIGAVFAFAAGCALFWFVPYVATAYGVTTPVVVLEDLSSSFDAFGRSWDLTRGRKLKVLGLALVAFILVGVPSAGIGALAGILRFTSASWAADARQGEIGRAHV